MIKPHVIQLAAAACLAFSLFAGSYAQAQPGKSQGKGVGLTGAASKRPALSVSGPAIPEPTGALLFGAGVLAAAAYTRKRRSA